MLSSDKVYKDYLCKDRSGTTIKQNYHTITYNKVILDAFQYTIQEVSEIRSNLIVLFQYC